MIGKSMIGRGPARAATVLAGLLVLIAAVLLFMSLTTLAANSQGMMKSGQERTLIGEIVAVDNVNNITVLTLRSDDLGEYPSDTVSIFLNARTGVLICNSGDSAQDLTAYRDAIVTYHELAGFAVADTVYEQC
ncbi:MAG TPA: hypothetical protein VL197_06550 [Nitrospirota bacterium]|nr:hypothetical protein [Nitrospirota bacterium]